MLVCVCVCVLVSDVGAVPELSAAPGSVWVGVDLDEPAGKHAGAVLGKSYFTARGSKHGTFVKPSNVTCGDYPEIDPFDEDEVEDEEAADNQPHSAQNSNATTASTTATTTSSSSAAGQTHSTEGLAGEKSSLYEEL